MIKPLKEGIQFKKKSPNREENELRNERSVLNNQTKETTPNNSEVITRTHVLVIEAYSLTLVTCILRTLY